MPETDPLRGTTVAVTRPDATALIDALVAAGADVVHVPLIAVGPPADGGAALAAALRRLDDFDWLVVTSVNGARAVADAGSAIPDGLRLAAVGPATARALAEAAGRPVDLVPSAPRGAGLVAEFPTGADHVLLVQADRAAATVADGLASAGHRVEAVTGYATTDRRPTDPERAQLRAADVVVFASGSAVAAWHDAGLGPGPAVVAIGPTTAASAAALGHAPDEVATAPEPAAIVAAVVRAATRSGAAGTTP